MTRPLATSSSLYIDIPVTSNCLEGERDRLSPQRTALIHRWSQKKVNNAVDLEQRLERAARLSQKQQEERRGRAQFFLTRVQRNRQRRMGLKREISLAAMLVSEPDRAHSSSSSEDRRDHGRDMMMDSPNTFTVRIESFKRKVSSRRIIAHWQQFRDNQKTTRLLALAFRDTGILDHNSKMLQSEKPCHLSFSSFDEFSARCREPINIKRVSAFTSRLEQRLLLLNTPLKIDPLPILKLVNPPRNQAPSSRGQTSSSHVDRYPARVLLSAFMISHYPDIVLDLKDGKKEGTKEYVLEQLATKTVVALETITSRILDLSSPSEVTDHASDQDEDQVPIVSPSPLTEGIGHFLAARKKKAPTVLTSSAGASSASTADLLLNFDETWFNFLVAFHDWKSLDSARLEASLIAMAVEMEKSLRRKIAFPPSSSPSPTSPSRPWEDIKAMEQQVADDHLHLRDKVAQLGGQEALSRLDNSLNTARWEVEEEIISRSSTQSSSQQAVRQGLARGFFNSPKSLEAQVASPSTLLGFQRLTPQEFSNLLQVNDLLHDPKKRIPTDSVEQSISSLLQPLPSDKAADPKALIINPEELQGLSLDQAVSLIRTRAKSIAEQTFWSEITHRVKVAIKSRSTPEVLKASAPLVAEASNELLTSLGSGPTAKKLRSELFLIEQGADHSPEDHDAFIARLLQSSHQPEPHILPDTFLHVLEVLGRNICSLGAPIRQRQSEEAQAQLKKELGASLHALMLARERREGEDEAESVVALALTRCIILLHLQIKIIKVDIANHRLQTLYDSLSSGGYSGFDYIQGRFREIYDLGPRVIPKNTQEHKPSASLISQNLPLTASWLTECTSAAKATFGYVSAFGGLDVDLTAKRIVEERKAEFNQGSAPPQVTMRAGRGDPHQLQSASNAPPVTTLAADPALFDSTEGLMRLALVCLIADGSRVIPETLLLDAEKLNVLQNEFQAMCVLSTCLLLSQQLSKTSQAMDRSRHKSRLLVLLADQNIDLDSLACEIASSSGDESVVQTVKAKKALQALLNVEGPAFRSLSRAISASLVAQVMLPRAQEAKDASIKILGRVGVGIIAEDVGSLSSKLSAFASIHGSIFMTEVYSPLLHQPSDSDKYIDIDEI